MLGNKKIYGCNAISLIWGFLNLTLANFDASTKVLLTLHSSIYITSFLFVLSSTNKLFNTATCFVVMLLTFRFIILFIASTSFTVQTEDNIVFSLQTFIISGVTNL